MIPCDESPGRELRDATLGAAEDRILEGIPEPDPTDPALMLIELNPLGDNDCWALLRSAVPPEITLLMTDDRGLALDPEIMVEKPDGMDCAPL